jgi:hypothetical protein
MSRQNINRMLEAYMQLFPAGMTRRIVMWESGTIYSEPVIKDQTSVRRQAQLAITKTLNAASIIHVDGFSLAMHGSLVVVIPRSTKKITGVDDLDLIEYSSHMLAKDRANMKVIFDGLAVLECQR